MGLGPYRQKRHFGVTDEPRGGSGRKNALEGHTFVIQKHAARRLHYDLRLELDGVMKSWAVTRGPSLVPGEKRLAVHVEDHPIEYNQFEGTIPKGEYGGGTVMIWDRGTWTPVGDPHYGYKKGHLDFRLDGEKLSGEWHLVRMHRREGERQDPWLLIKANDEAARSPKEPDILEEQPLSVASGRDMEEITVGKKPKAVRHRPAASTRATRTSASAKPRTTPRKRERGTKTAAKRARSAARKGEFAETPSNELVRRAPLPDFIEPCLALLSAKAPSTGEWVHEIKFDGYRIEARLERGKVQLLTRTGLDWTHKFPAVAKAVETLSARTALIDGEIVIETEQGVSSFSALQEALKAGRGEFLFYVFDLLYLNGYDLREAPLSERKKSLKELVGSRPRNDILRYSEDFETEGPLLLERACEMKLEGIISKRRDAPYHSGRNGDWLKTKCTGSQEFIIVGFVPATNDARAVGALVLGYYENGELQYAGRVGTGFTRQSARALWRELQPLRRPGSPFQSLPPEERRRGALWTEAQLVAEIDFTGWTHGGRLRHPSFKGLRRDKPAAEVVRETAAMTASRSTNTRLRTGVSERIKTTGATKMTKQPTIAGVTLSHPDRVYWDDVGLTKQALADYYVSVWDWIAPYVTGRVLAVVRCPEGASGACFFQKHATAGLDTPHLKRVREEDDEVIAIDGLSGLIALVQAGVLEIHTRGSRVDRLDAADRVVFDLDPGPGVGWPEIKRAALDVRKRLEAIGLQSCLKTTGGKGLHVVVPIEDTLWDAVKAFARGFAQSMVDAEPDRFLAVATKAKRPGKIFIDYLRNSREATSICPFSTRARPGATVAVPLGWSELAALAAPDKFTVANVGARLRRLKQDPWAGTIELKQRLSDAGGRSKPAFKRAGSKKAVSKK